MPGSHASRERASGKEKVPLPREGKEWASGKENWRVAKRELAVAPKARLPVLPTALPPTAQGACTIDICPIDVLFAQPSVDLWYSD